MMKSLDKSYGLRYIETCQQKSASCLCLGYLNKNYLQISLRPSPRKLKKLNENKWVLNDENIYKENYKRIYHSLKISFPQMNKFTDSTSSIFIE